MIQEYLYQWPTLPPSVVELLRTHSNEINRLVGHEIRHRLPASSSTDRRLLAHGVELLSKLFLELVSGQEQPSQEWFDTCWALGRYLARNERTINDARATLQVGRIAAWRYYREVGVLTEMPSDMVALLAEVIFTYADAIEAAVAVGYSEAELYPGSEVQIQRSQLLRALVGESASSPEDICSLSRSAQWRLPRTVCAIVLSNRELTVRRTPKLPPDVLADLDRPDPCLLMPDPGGPKRLDRMARALDGWTAVLGPTVALPEAANSMRWARTILTAESYGIVAGDGLVRCSDHWATLMLVQDIDLARTVVKERLAPLLELRDDMRNKLVETLLVWLQAGQNACTAATQLCVHSQTVRYRLRQLDDLLGPQLQDPNAQKELIIALSAYQLLENMNNQGMQRDGETEPRTTTSLSPQRNAC